MAKKNVIEEKERSAVDEIAPLFEGLIPEKHCCGECLLLGGCCGEE